jgi:primosomal protein N'
MNCPKCHSRKIKYLVPVTQKAEVAIEALAQEIKNYKNDQILTARKFAT